MKLRIANIDDHLEMILPGLKDIHAKYSPDWQVEDVVEECRAGRWILVVSDEPGFAMFSITEHRFTRDRQLFIEVACHPNTDKTVKHYQEFWDFMARQLSCKEICMVSKRKGWEKLGWVGGWIQYSRSVPEAENG